MREVLAASNEFYPLGSTSENLLREDSQPLRSPGTLSGIQRHQKSVRISEGHPSPIEVALVRGLCGKGCWVSIQQREVLKE